jgi:hypothetical protein
MARTAVPIVTLSKTGAATNAGTTADPTNDHIVDLAGVPLDEIVFRFTNTNGTDRVATIVAGDSPPALSNGLGNLDITVPATSGDMTVAGLESARFLQSDGTIHIDLAASFAGAVRAFRVPRA